MSEIVSHLFHDFFSYRIGEGAGKNVVENIQQMVDKTTPDQVEVLGFLVALHDVVSREVADYGNYRNDYSQYQYDSGC